jgi:hypothetical protein
MFKKILEKLTRNGPKRSITHGQAKGYEEDRYYNFEGEENISNNSTVSFEYSIKVGNRLLLAPISIDNTPCVFLLLHHSPRGKY